MMDLFLKEPVVTYYAFFDNIILSNSNRSVAIVDKLTKSKQLFDAHATGHAFPGGIHLVFDSFSF